MDDIGVLHSTMAAAGYGVFTKESGGGEGGGTARGRKARERSVLDPSWRLRCHVAAASLFVATRVVRRTHTLG